MTQHSARTSHEEEEQSAQLTEQEKEEYRQRENNSVSAQIAIALAGLGSTHYIRNIKDSSFLCRDVDVGKLLNDRDYKERIREAAQRRFGFGINKEAVKRAREVLSVTDKHHDEQIKRKGQLSQYYLPEIERIYGLSPEEMEKVKASAQVKLKENPDLSFQYLLQIESQQVLLGRHEEEVKKIGKGAEEEVKREGLGLDSKEGEKKYQELKKAGEKEFLEKNYQIAAKNTAFEQRTALVSSDEDNHNFESSQETRGKISGILEKYRGRGTVRPNMHYQRIENILNKIQDRISLFRERITQNIRRIISPLTSRVKPVFSTMSQNLGRIFSPITKRFNLLGAGINKIFNGAKTLIKQAVYRIADLIIPGSGLVLQTWNKINDTIKAFTGIDINKFAINIALFVIFVIVAIIFIFFLLFFTNSKFASKTSDTARVSYAPVNNKVIYWSDFEREFLSGLNNQNDDYSWTGFEIKYFVAK